MRIRKWMQVVAVASLVGAGAAAPAWAHGGSATLQNGDTATTLQNSDSGALQNGDTATLQNGDSVTIQNGDTAATSQSDDSGTPQSSSEDTAPQSGTIIRKDALPDEPAQASERTGAVDSSAGPTLSGSGAQPGNMGPGNMKGQ